MQTKNVNEKNSIYFFQWISIHLNHFTDKKIQSSKIIQIYVNFFKMYYYYICIMYEYKCIICVILNWINTKEYLHLSLIKKNHILLLIPDKPREHLRRSLGARLSAFGFGARYSPLAISQSLLCLTVCLKKVKNADRRERRTVQGPQDHPDRPLFDKPRNSHHNGRSEHFCR